MKVKKNLRHFFPEKLINLYHKTLNRSNNSNILFRGDDSLFKEIVKNANIYGEYGCGNSTKWVLKNTSSKIISVDTDDAWIKYVKKENNSNIHRLNIYHCNLGETREWGYPKSYSKKYYFSDYTNYLWVQIEKPDVVLIDGRFRVCCFLTSLKFSNENTRILFDDYIDRTHYHFVEKYLSPVEQCGIQSLFVVPPKNKINLVDLDKDICAFRNVMD